jgi:hypothetical protein
MLRSALLVAYLAAAAAEGKVQDEKKDGEAKKSESELHAEEYVKQLGDMTTGGQWTSYKGVETFPVSNEMQTKMDKALDEVHQLHNPAMYYLEKMFENMKSSNYPDDSLQQMFYDITTYKGITYQPESFCCCATVTYGMNNQHTISFAPKLSSTTGGMPRLPEEPPMTPGFEAEIMHELMCIPGAALGMKMLTPQEMAIHGRSENLGCMDGMGESEEFKSELLSGAVPLFPTMENVLEPVPPHMELFPTFHFKETPQTQLQCGALTGESFAASPPPPKPPPPSPPPVLGNIADFQPDGATNEWKSKITNVVTNIRKFSTSLGLLKMAKRNYGSACCCAMGTINEKELEFKVADAVKCEDQLLPVSAYGTALQFLSRYPSTSKYYFDTKFFGMSELLTKNKQLKLAQAFTGGTGGSYFAWGLKTPGETIDDACNGDFSGTCADAFLTPDAKGTLSSTDGSVGESSIVLQGKSFWRSQCVPFKSTSAFGGPTALDMFVGPKPLNDEAARSAFLEANLEKANMNCRVLLPAWECPGFGACRSYMLADPSKYDGGDLATKMRFGADRVTAAPVEYDSSYDGTLVAYVDAATASAGFSLKPATSNAWASFEFISIVAAGCNADTKAETDYLYPSPMSSSWTGACKEETHVDQSFFVVRHGPGAFLTETVPIVPSCSAGAGCSLESKMYAFKECNLRLDMDWSYVNPVTGIRTPSFSTMPKCFGSIVAHNPCLTKAGGKCNKEEEFTIKLLGTKHAPKDAKRWKTVSNTVTWKAAIGAIEKDGINPEHIFESAGAITYRATAAAAKVMKDWVGATTAPLLA